MMAFINALDSIVWPLNRLDSDPLKSQKLKDMIFPKCFDLSFKAL